VANGEPTWVVVWLLVLLSAVVLAAIWLVVTT
jgi:hypothetical protein